MQVLAQELKLHHLKATPQRLAIYKIIKESKEHPTVEMIYKQLEPFHSTMSLATVYKTVEALHQKNLIQSIKCGDGKSRYDGDTSAHSHFICDSCHRVFDLYDDGLQELKNKIEHEHDFEIHSQQLFFYGRCKNCQ